MNAPIISNTIVLKSYYYLKLRTANSLKLGKSRLISGDE